MSACVETGRRRLSLRTRLGLLLSVLALLTVGTATAGAAAAHVKQSGARARVARVSKSKTGSAQPDLGPNVYVFTPQMPQSQIQATVDQIANQQVSNQFGRQRYALLFEPGTYGSAGDPLIFQVGYYTQVAGLGKSPGDVTINGSVDVYNQCTNGDQSQCTALDNFWRSLSNLTINATGQSGCKANTEFWAVSQAAPMRRVQINGGTTLMDYCDGGPDYASGGFIADSTFTGGTVVNGSQQQFYVRNSSLDGWSNAVWNQVFSGDVGAPAQSFPNPPYTTLPTTPVSQEEPFLETNAKGRLHVFVPALRRNSTGTDWQGTTEAGRSIPISHFFVASPSTSVRAINSALVHRQNLLLTPGVYDLSRPIQVRRQNTVVLGLGFPTLVPQRGTAAMIVRGVPGVKLSGTIFDAGPKNSPALLEIGARHGSHKASADDPTLVQDVFFRIGGATPGKATDSLVVNSSHVILDDIWAWRADHGNGVGWTQNTGAHGLVVNGGDVTATGLAVEHYQKSQVVWNGEHGRDIFFQSEMPYDVPNQAAWMESPTVDGYPSFQVRPDVSSFSGWGMGSYCTSIRAFRSRRAWASSRRTLRAFSSMICSPSSSTAPAASNL